LIAATRAQSLALSIMSLTKLPSILR